MNKKAHECPLLADLIEIVQIYEGPVCRKNGQATAYPLNPIQLDRLPFKMSAYLLLGNAGWHLGWPDSSVPYYAGQN